MWILEWPAGATIGMLWPGAPSFQLYKWETRECRSQCGWNMLANLHPQLFFVHIKQSRNEQGFYTACLPIWESNRRNWIGCSAWLVIDYRHPELFGQVLNVRLDDMLHVPRFCLNEPIHDEFIVELLPFSLAERKQMENQSKHLPFIDWLSVSIQQYCLGLRPHIKSRIRRDIGTVAHGTISAWKPAVDNVLMSHGERGEGGSFWLYPPCSAPVGPYVSKVLHLCIITS